MKKTKLIINKNFYSSLSDLSKLNKRKRLTKAKKFSFSVAVAPPNLQEILIGLLLGDLNAEKQSINGNTRLRFAQGLVLEPYLFNLYYLFQEYSSSLPRNYESKADTRTDKIYSTVIFKLIVYLVLINIINYFIKIKLK